MYDLETAGLAFGRLSAEFIRTKVVPELDAFRFAAYCGKTGVTKVEGALADGSAVLQALRAASTALDEAEVPLTERYLFITPSLHGMVPVSYTHLIILGVNAPQYTEEQLRELADANERGVTYNGQHYTLYEAGQEQSRLENAVRTCKRHILMNRETGDAKNLKNNQIRLRVLQSEYGKFCKATGRCV